MEILMFIVPLILAILGALIRFGKATFLISGYNTSSKQEKEKYTSFMNKKTNPFYKGDLFFIFIDQVNL